MNAAKRLTIVLLAMLALFTGCGGGSSDSATVEANSELEWAMEACPEEKRYYETLAMVRQQAEVEADKHPNTTWIQEHLDRSTQMGVDAVRQCKRSIEQRFVPRHLRMMVMEHLADAYNYEVKIAAAAPEEAQRLEHLVRVERTVAKLYREAAADPAKAIEFCNDEDAVQRSEEGVEFPLAYIVCQEGTR